MYYATLKTKCNNLWWFERQWPSKGMALFGVGVVLLEEVCHCGGGL